jgi:hypothetical protein
LAETTSDTVLIVSISDTPFTRIIGRACHMLRFLYALYHLPPIHAYCLACSSVVCATRAIDSSAWRQRKNATFSKRQDPYSTLPRMYHHHRPSYPGAASAAKGSGQRAKER